MQEHLVDLGTPRAMLEVGVPSAATDLLQKFYTHIHGLETPSQLDNIRAKLQQALTVLALSTAVCGKYGEGHCPADGRTQSRGALSGLAVWTTPGGWTLKRSSRTA